jgi:diguanylate cyclase (GGDEF)-like protein
MKDLAIFLYYLALVAQTAATILSFAAYRFVGKYRSGWLILALGLLLMTGRRITPLIHIQTAGMYSLLDAVLAVLISVLLLIGIYVITKIIQDWQLKGSQLEKLLSFDFLTKAFSRAEIIRRGEVEIERCKRSGHPLAVLELDIDHFKNVNDQFGHSAGDDVLKSLSRQCMKTLREIDLFGRVGGEEFLAILPETNKNEAIEVAERLRKKIENTIHKTNCNQELKITISIGVTTYFPNDEIPPNKSNAQILQILMKYADDAMYEAKAAGRNQIAIR